MSKEAANLVVLTTDDEMYPFDLPSNFKIDIEFRHPLPEIDGEEGVTCDTSYTEK